MGRPKQALIERGANAWLKQLGTRNLPWRFDVIEVRVRLAHISNTSSLSARLCIDEPATVSAFSTIKSSTHYR